MTGYVLVAAFLLSALANWSMVRGVDWLPHDRPNERSLHAHVVPRSGGVGLVLGVGLAALLSSGFGLAAVLLLALLLALLSLADDARGLPVRLRFGAQVVAALAFLWFYAPPAWGAAAWLLGLLTLVWLTNLYNFMDGSDGLAGGMAVFGFGAYGVAAWLAGDATLALAAGALAAAAVGFLLFNFHPARIFMGDVGSIPLGFLAAALGLVGYWRGLWPWAFPLLVFSPFVVDASVTLLRRLLRGEKVWQAHRSHYYQRLVRSGMGHRATALWAYGLMALCVAAALYLRQRPDSMPFILLAFGMFYTLLTIGLDRRWRRFAPDDSL